MAVHSYPKVVSPPTTAEEAATRFAVLVHFGKEQIPTLEQLAQWSGLPERKALDTVREWHPELARMISGELH